MGIPSGGANLARGVLPLNGLRTNQLPVNHSEGKCETHPNDASLSVIEGSVPVPTQKKKITRKKSYVESEKRSQKGKSYFKLPLVLSKIPTQLEKHRNRQEANNRIHRDESVISEFQKETV